MLSSAGNYFVIGVGSLPASVILRRPKISVMYPENEARDAPASALQPDFMILSPFKSAMLYELRHSVSSI
jgi:hypothetical protein